MRRLALVLVLPVLVFGAGCGGDDDDDGGSVAASVSGSGSFCDRAESVQAEFDSLDSEFSGSELPSGDVFDRAADAIADLADDAPSEIKADLETVADGVREIADLFGEVDLSDPEALNDPDNAEALQEMSTRMGELDEKVTGASDRVETYLKDECGIDPDQ
jgi:hypothetical protein